MALHVTTDIIEAAYELLCITPPFNKWGLPHKDAIEFHASHISGDAQGEYYFKNNRHVIRVNPKRHKTLHAVVMTLGHEVCHLHEYNLGSRRTGCHGAVFNRLADQVCRRHGFDRGQF